MEIDQSELLPKGRKSRTPLIIGIVVGLHVVLIGSAFIIQEINKRTQPLEEAVAEPEHAPATLAEAPTSPVIETTPALEAHLQASAPAPTQPVRKTPATQTVVKTYVVKKGDTWSGLAVKLGTPSKELARQNRLDVKKFLRIGQKLTYRQTVSVTPAMVTASVDSAATDQSFATYEVKKGDTLGSIATRHAMRLKDLKDVNGLKNDLIVVGQKLKVSEPGPRPSSRSLLVDVHPRSSAPKIHTVVAGDTVSGLARRYGVSQNVILRVNNIDDPRKIGIGSRIKIPPQQDRSASGDLTSAHVTSPALPRSTEYVAAKF